MAASVLKFEYKVMATSREECIESLDKIVDDIILKEGGEPWISITETYEKVMTDQKLALDGDPRGFLWIGVRSVVFAGPTKIDLEGPTFRDGFRPQQPDDSTSY